jgi:hypothetical protein
MGLDGLLEDLGWANSLELRDVLGKEWVSSQESRPDGALPFLSPASVADVCHILSLPCQAKGPGCAEPDGMWTSVFATGEDGVIGNPITPVASGCVGKDWERRDPLFRAKQDDGRTIGWRRHEEPRASALTLAGNSGLE